MNARRPAGRLAIHGGGGPSGGGGGSTPGASCSRMNPAMNWSGGSGSSARKRCHSASSAGVRSFPAQAGSRSARLSEPRAVRSGEGERGGTAARVADEMETVEAASIGLAQNPLHFGVEAETRRRLLPGVHLEILRNRTPRARREPAATPHSRPAILRTSYRAQPRCRRRPRSSARGSARSASGRSTRAGRSRSARSGCPCRRAPARSAASRPHARAAASHRAPARTPRGRAAPQVSPGASDRAARPPTRSRPRRRRARRRA